VPALEVVGPVRRQDVFEKPEVVGHLLRVTMIRRRCQGQLATRRALIAEEVQDAVPVG
jgi:hypothetical protein